MRASGSGAGCGAHWPVCNGEILPREARVATLVEFSHRVTSGLALVAVVALALWTFRACGKGHPARTAAALSLFFMLTEAAAGAGLVLFAAWSSGTVAGVFGGSVLGDPATYGFDAMFPALFLALLAGQLGDGRARVAALAGALIALALTPAAPPGIPIVAAAAAALVALRPERPA